MLNWEEICPSRVLGVIIHHMFFQKYGRIDFYKFSGKKQKQNSTSLAFQKKKKDLLRLLVNNYRDCEIT